MISQVLTPNILITDNPLLVANFNSVRSSYTSFQQFFNDNKTQFSNENYLLLQSDNVGITNFNFEIGTTKPGGSGGYTCNVEFLETGTLFERRLLKSKIQQVLNSNKKSSVNLRTFYIAFGVSDDLKYWSNFQACPYLRAEIFQNFNQAKIIKLTFKVISLDQDFDQLLSNQDLDIDGIANIDINNVTYEGVLSPLRFKKIDATKELVDYFFGANSFDHFLKNVTNNFLRALYGQVGNVFLVCRDLKQLLFNNIRMPINDKDDPNKGVNPKIFDFYARSMAPTSADDPFISKYAVLKQYRVVSNVLQSLPGLAKANLNIDLIFPQFDAERMKNGINFTGKLAFRQADHEDLNLEEKKKKLLSFLDTIRDGLKTLTGKEIILIKESDTAIIHRFYDFIPEQLRSELPFNKDQPLILFGEKDIIRSIVYGEEYKNLPLLNKEMNSYFKKVTKTYNLYGSHIDEIDTYTEAFPDFPIFRFNVTNPNVLSINVENNNLYNVFLQAAFTKPIEYSSAYALSLENELFNKLLGRGNTKESPNKGIPRVRNELFDLLDISKSVVISNDLKIVLQQLKDKKDAILDKLLDEDNLINYFEFIIKLSSTNDYSNPENVKDIINEKLRNGIIRQESNGKWVNNFVEPTDKLGKKINEFIQSNYSFSDEDYRSVLYITYAILGMLNDEKDFSTGYDKIEALNYTIERSSSNAEKEAALDDALIYTDMFKQISNYIFTLEIKTLPFFGISSQYWVGKHCILYAKRSSLIGDTQVDLFDDFLSGGYRILRMRHDITKDTCESTFVLQKVSSNIGDLNRYDKDNG